MIRSYKKRCKQHKYASLRGHILERIDIDQRSVIVDKRIRYRDWEGDSMVGYKHQGRFVTQVERKSRYLLAERTIDGTAKSFNKANLSLFKKIPNKDIKTMTLDNGSENSQFKIRENSLSISLFFAKPYASYERGTNENTNGLLRRYFPKGTNFLKVTKEELDKAVYLLNHRPRKCLKYRTPFEVFNSITGGVIGT